jgi:hypothetical protein
MSNVPRPAYKTDRNRAFLEKWVGRKLTDEQWTAVTQSRWFRRWEGGDAAFPQLQDDALEFLRSIDVVARSQDAPSEVELEFLAGETAPDIDVPLSNLLARHVEEHYASDLGRIRSWLPKYPASHEQAHKWLLRESEAEAKALGGSPENWREQRSFEEEASRAEAELAARGESLFAVNGVWARFWQQRREQNAADELHGKKEKWPFGVPALDWLCLYLHLEDRPFLVEVPYYRQWGRLHEVHTFSAHLGQWMRWGKGAATRFILAGEVPAFRQVERRFEPAPKAVWWWYSRVPGAQRLALPRRLNRFVFEVDPTVAPRDLATLYGEVRANLIDYHKPVGAQHAALADFVTDPANANLAPKALMEAWNAKEEADPAEPDKGPRLYSNLSQFNQHAKLAKNRLLNPPYNAGEQEGEGDDE